MVASFTRRRRRRRPHRRCKMMYKGHRLRRPDEKLAQVEGDQDPLHFFREFVAKRRPCVLRGYAKRGGLGAVSNCVANARKWCKTLCRLAGSKSVQVEVRNNAGERPFGNGSEETVSVSRFVRRVEASAASGEPCRWYMTTQQLETDEEGRPSLASEPCSSLLSGGRVPLRPPLIPTLVPANMNLWMGAGGSGNFGTNSSGLHHDFHDNLLVVVCGEKSLRLWDPSLSVRMMPTGGEPIKVHSNGRIVYKSRPLVKADGRDHQANRASKLASRLESATSDDEIERLLDQALDVERADAKDSQKAEKAPPENFSTLSRHNDARPGVPEKLKSAPSSEITQLRDGDAIYIPAGWWHEVSSQRGIHAAYNVWTHPPDTADFFAPYSSRFWQREWEDRFRS